MLILYTLMIGYTQAVLGYSFITYNSDSHLDGFCLPYYSLDGYTNCGKLCSDPYIAQIMSYCFRPVEDVPPLLIFDFQPTINLNITFNQLRLKNITSEILLSWSASLEIAERYQIFLDNHSISPTEHTVIFYNCTPPWFGPLCRFSFDYLPPRSFNHLFHLISDFKDIIFISAKVSCYIHLTCQTQALCLDWREICDGKLDCEDDADEENCWELEMNECAEDEYRCLNGQCIPWKFYGDDSYQGECLDRTDEILNRRFPHDECYKNADFVCEESTCRPDGDEFPCGDGECTSEVSKCANGRHPFLPKNFCTNVTLCSMFRYDYVDHKWCEMFSLDNNFVQENCSRTYEFRYLPPLFGHVRYIISDETIDSGNTHLPHYICYDARRCPHFPPSNVSFDQLTCRRFDEFGLRDKMAYYNPKLLVATIKKLFRGCLITEKDTYNCDSATMHQCINSRKCISKYRVRNGIEDCPFGDDETHNQSCFLSDVRQRFKCRGEGNEKCLTVLALENGKEECTYGEDEYGPLKAFMTTHISFQVICDGIPHLLPLLIDGHNETDETGCETWECNNTYSRCNGMWSCKNGADEVNCPFSTCHTHHHSCVFLNDTSKVSCIPLNRAGDDIDDCIGGADERMKNLQTPSTYNHDSLYHQFRCHNGTKLISMNALCNNKSDCLLKDDETFCKHFETLTFPMCQAFGKNQTDVEKFLCEDSFRLFSKSIILFKLNNVLTYPLQLATVKSSTVPTNHLKSPSMEGNEDIYLPSDIAWKCNRGVPIRSLLRENISRLSCLCPPSYYGDKCQYQNQRISLTLQMQLTSDWRKIFVFLITLIDAETNIESYEHIEHIPGRYCLVKYNIYLLYAARPKNASRTYSVRIDAFTGTTLNYRASWIFPLRFPFLPVHRLAVLLKVPFSIITLSQETCSPFCVYGQCTSYANDRNSTFCHCESGWSGSRCDIKVRCECASEAVCVSDSICLCPLGRFGPRCHLSHSVCHSEPCMNGGQCVTLDARYTAFTASSYICLCPEEYIGDRCEYRRNQTQIDISFHHKLTIPLSLDVHLIAARDHEILKPNRTSIGKKLQFDQSSLTLYTTISFNIAIAQMLGDYYLIVLREETITLAHISTEVIPDHRCRSLAELFSSTFINQHLLKRIKSYHLPCKQHQELICFYDEIHMCLCTLDRTANCLEFDHNMTYECEKAKFCGDAGECFQDDLACPTSSFCTCDRCYFGSRCQFSTRGSTLSLDIILGYHFRSKTSIHQQPTIVKSATALTSIIFAFGLINGVLSFQTFRRKESQSVGCGLYLLTTSLVSIITVVILALKFAILIAVQVGSIDNHRFVYFQCVSIDFLLRCLVSMSDWLSACVAVERAVNVTKGVKFDKTKSKRIARWITGIVVLCVSCSYVYDPIHRQVMVDEEEQHIWCITQYSSFVQMFDWMMNIVHFSFPFVINDISALIVIITITRTRINAQKSKSLREHLHEQLHHHKHLIISPLILVALAIPRLVISFVPGCMGSARESWLYLIGCYISFIPVITTLLVFILPSELYNKEFCESIKRMWHR